MSSWKIGYVAVAKFQGYPLWRVKIFGEVEQASGPSKFSVFCYWLHDFQRVSTQSLHDVKLKRTEALQKNNNVAKRASYEMHNDPEIYQPYLEKYRAMCKGTVYNSTDQPGHLSKYHPSKLSPDIGSQSSDLSKRLTQAQQELEAVKANLREEISSKVSDRVNNQLAQSAESNISDVSDSLMVEYSPKFDFIEKQLKSIKNSFIILEKRVKKIKSRLDDIEQEDRLNSFIFSGVKQASGC